MKAIYYVLISLLYCCTTVAQTITKAEYFFDVEPGVGLATPFTISPGSTISISNGSIPTTGLGAGFHNLALRVQDAAGTWTQTEIRPFFITELSIATSSLQSAEYFFDTDPGVGMATAITIPSGNSVNASLVIPILSLPVGFHNLVIRVQNNSGVWSQREIRPFYIVADDFITRNIVAAEYFIDIDPGLGSAAPIIVPSPTPVFISNTQLPLPGNISEGQHFLFVRVKDNLDRWSLFSLDTFTIANPLPVTGMELAVTQSGNNHLLRWNTLTEQNTRKFEVGHSTDGVNFSAIGAVAAAGNSNNLLRYSFTALRPAAGIHFYRLAQMDIDGKIVYTNIVTIRNNADQLSFAVYPNPTKGNIEMRFAGKEKQVVVHITDMQGRSVLRSLLANQPVLQLNTTGLISGMYIIQLTDGTTTQMGRFVKE